MLNSAKLSSVRFSFIINFIFLKLSKYVSVSLIRKSKFSNIDFGKQYLRVSKKNLSKLSAFLFEKNTLFLNSLLVGIFSCLEIKKLSTLILPFDLNCISIFSLSDQ